LAEPRNRGARTASGAAVPKWLWICGVGPGGVPVQGRCWSCCGAVLMCLRRCAARLGRVRRRRGVVQGNRRRRTCVSKVLLEFGESATGQCRDGRDPGDVGAVAMGVAAGRAGCGGRLAIEAAQAAFGG